MDVLRSALPAGTLSGAPKVRAMQIIDELEPVKRCSYGGAIGYLSWDGDLDTAIHIRTVVVKDGRLHVQAGGGTVADAKPAYEYNESVNKARGGLPRRRGRLRTAGLGMTMRVLVIDNYDSFTYNLVQYLGELGSEIEVVRNDSAEVGELLERGPGPPRRLTGPLHAGRGGHLDRGDPRLRRGGDAGARRLPRAPGDGRGLRRPGRPGRAGPRQGRRGRATTAARSTPGCRPLSSPVATTRWSPTPPSRTSSS